MALPSRPKVLTPPAADGVKPQPPEKRKPVIVSSEALERLKDILPRADVHYLEAEYCKWFADKEPARNEDARFLKWARGYWKKFNPGQ